MNLHLILNSTIHFHEFLTSFQYSPKLASPYSSLPVLSSLPIPNGDEVKVVFRIFHYTRTWGRNRISVEQGWKSSTPLLRKTSRKRERERERARELRENGKVVLRRWVEVTKHTIREIRGVKVTKEFWKFRFPEYGLLVASFSTPRIIVQGWLDPTYTISRRWEVFVRVQLANGLSDS